MPGIGPLKVPPGGVGLYPQCLGHPKHTIPETRMEPGLQGPLPLLRLLDERTPEARAAYARALGDFQALDREIERDLGPCQGPMLRLTSGVEVHAGELAATWRALQELAQRQDSADLLHEVLHVARDPRYRSGVYGKRLRERGLLTHWGMRESVREVVLASLYEIEHDKLVEYKLVPPTQMRHEPHD